MKFRGGLLGRAFLFISFFCLPSLSFADEIRLKSGEVIRGEIVQETTESIKVKINGVDTVLTYYMGDVQEVVGREKPVGMETTTHAVSPEVPVAQAQENWWKYSQVKDGIESQMLVKATSLGHEDVAVAGVMYKGALKERVVTDITRLGKDHTLEECTVWSVPGAGRVRESCSSKKEELDSHVVKDVKVYTKELRSANVDGMQFGENGFRWFLL